MCQFKEEFHIYKGIACLRVPATPVQMALYLEFTKTPDRYLLTRSVLGVGPNLLAAMGTPLLP